jgi:hypothetical protein
MISPIEVVFKLSDQFISLRWHTHILQLILMYDSLIKQVTPQQAEYHYRSTFQRMLQLTF